MTYHSAVYEGRVMHRRHVPTPHKFSYQMGQLYLDLDEIDQLFKHRWFWSVNRPNLAEWRRNDYLDSVEGLSLTEAVRARLRQQLGAAPGGPIRLLTHPRYAGYVFNPVSFYYCYEEDGQTLSAILAEITNTPWKQRHCIALSVKQAQRKGETLQWRFDKRFHVSPFMPMDCHYDWGFTKPGGYLNVHMHVYRQEQEQFDAHLHLTRYELDATRLARLLWRFPLMTLQVIGAIHWQSLKLWLKRTPIYDHPGTKNGEPQ